MRSERRQSIERMEENSNFFTESDGTVDFAGETEDYPAWFDGKKVNEVLFCTDFLRENPMVCVHGNFFTADGWVSDENLLKNRIYNAIKPYVSGRRICWKSCGLSAGPLPCRYTRTGFTLPTGRCLWMGISQRTGSSASTVCQSGTTRTRPRRNGG